MRRFRTLEPAPPTQNGKYGSAVCKAVCTITRRQGEPTDDLESIVLAAAIIVIAASALSLTQSTDDALDPVRVAPDTHKVAFENAFVRVLEVTSHPEASSRDIGTRMD